MSIPKQLTLALTAAVSVASAQVPAYTGYWNKRTDKGSEVKCSSATTESGMEKILRSAGWPVEQGIPSVNWNVDEVVVVAPSKFYKSANLAFYGLKREGDTIVLDYGWATIKGSESVGANSASFGSVGEGYPATIVIAHRRGIDAGLKFVCRDRGVTG